MVVVLAVDFGSLKLERCKHGWMMFYGPVIGKSFELYGEYSESEVAMMAAYVRAGDTVIDVGANIGALTLPLAGLVGERGRVYAIESDPVTFNTLCGNLALNAVRQVMPINAFVRVDAASGTNGIYGDSFVGERWPPAFMKLDGLGLDACALIKIDVDGRELEVLQSAARLIEGARPVLYFENDHREKSRPLLRHVFDLGYEAYWHAAPLFRPDNFRGNAYDAWAPVELVSWMVLCLPSEKSFPIPNLDLIQDAGEWWPQWPEA